MGRIRFLRGSASVDDAADLVMPAACIACGTGQTWPMVAVIEAATGTQPLMCYKCGARMGIREVSVITFFKKDEWEAWDEDDADQAEPQQYRIGALFQSLG